MRRNLEISVKIRGEEGEITMVRAMMKPERARMTPKTFKLRIQVEDATINISS